MTTGSRRSLAALLLITLAAGFLIGYLVRGSSTKTAITKATTPNVVGMTTHDAVSLIRAKALKAIIEDPVSSSSVPSGHVLAQAPAAGSLVGIHSTVAITVSAGPSPLSSSP
jgi:beta-lactam-binding protein with PASTA domain